MTSPSSAAYQLEGCSLADGWTVLSRLESPDGHTGGACSVGYLALHDSGTPGFVKAIDYSEALEEDDPARALEALTSAYNAERDLLLHCEERKLRRIVRALAAGTYRVDGASPPVVNYLILELADGDARDMVERSLDEMVPMLHLAHHAAVGMAQLHSVGVAHQDLKPSNLLVWSDASNHEGKLGDLGCAHRAGHPGPYDDATVPGDPAYAPPEQLYDSADLTGTITQRNAADVYMLGSLIAFLMTGVPFSGIVMLSLDQSQGPSRWQGSFDEVLPGLIDAHGKAVTRLRSAMHTAIGGDVAELVGQLCYPDPRWRGDPIARRYDQDPYSLERCVTRLNLLERRAHIALRASG